MARATIDQDRLREAKDLIDGGASRNQVYQATGISPITLRKYFGPASPDPTPGGSNAPPQKPADPTPGGSGTARKSPPKPHKPRATDEQLASLFAKIASAPAVPMLMWFHCEFCATHFASTGPEAATKLVELSQDHPALRSVMETAYRYYDQAAWAGILGVWLGVPMLHHLAPDAIYSGARIFAPSLPPRDEQHVHTPEAASRAEGNGNGHAPTPPDVIQTPFGMMDTDQLIRMAESFGISIDLTDNEPVIDGTIADEYADSTPTPEPAEPTTEPTTASESAAEDTAVEAAPPDSDASE
jgi:hypothetical protein